MKEKKKVEQKEIDPLLVAPISIRYRFALAVKLHAKLVDLQ
jgi:hypothetical protein